MMPIWASKHPPSYPYLTGACRPPSNSPLTQWLESPSKRLMTDGFPHIRITCSLILGLYMAKRPLTSAFG
eukprot:scaffold126205_cov36-Tisochrysis_lutea.AAC.4